jgi:thiamine-phosphate pyrophosphorylase
LRSGGKREITGGVYLVVDPSYGEDHVLSVAKAAMDAGLDVLQLWASWKEEKSAVGLGRMLSELAESYSVPFLVNNDLNIAEKVDADGVHLDGYEPTPASIRERLGNNTIVGVTCGTDWEKVIHAAADGVTYVSFCSVFPSPSVNVCDLVPLEMISETRRKIQIPIFASGGVTAENAHKVLQAGADGIAVISEIMKAKDPGEATRRLKEIVSKNVSRNRVYSPDLLKSSSQNAVVSVP